MAKQKWARRRYLLAVTGFALGMTLALSGVGLAVNLRGGGHGDPGRALAEAEARLVAQDFGGAIPLLNRVLEASPENANVLHLLGYSHSALGEYEAALDYYMRALMIEPTHVGANEYLGELHLEMGDLAGAEERLLTLTRACGGCAAQKDLEMKIRAYKRRTEG